MSDSDAVDSSFSETSASSPTMSPPAEKEQLNSVTAEELRLGSDRKRRRKLPLWSRESIEAAAYDRDRMSYEHMLVRYGSWSNVRGQVLAYTLLTVIAFVYKSHCDFIDLTESMNTVDEGRHVHCCCQQSERSCYLEEQAAHCHSGSFLEYGKFLLAFVGRRAALMITVLAGFVCSLLLIFSHPTAGLQAIHILMNLCVASVMLISMANLTEMLPYRMRFFAVSCYTFASGITNSIASLHFYSGFSFQRLALLSGFGYLGGIFILSCVIRDSICHLNIRNKADEVEELIRKEEMRLLESNPDGGVYYHSRVARKIFEDLVYLDRDELKLINFLKRLWRNSIMLEIVIAIFQSVSAGLHEYEMGRFWAEQFRGPYLVQIDRITGYFLAFVTIVLLRKVHRVKALAYVFSVSLLIAGLRHAVVEFDKHNGCADIELIETKYNVFSSILSVLSTCFGTCLQILILLHFLETTPSILRLTAPMMVYLPMKCGLILGTKIIGDRSNDSLQFIVPVYTYHIIIIIVTLVRSKSALPYSLYMFDLMPVSEKEPESEREDSDDEEPLLVPARNTSMVVCDSRKKDDLDGSSKGFDPIAGLEKMMKRKAENRRATTMLSPKGDEVDEIPMDTTTDSAEQQQQPAPADSPSSSSSSSDAAADDLSGDLGEWKLTGPDPCTFYPVNRCKAAERLRYYADLQLKKEAAKRKKEQKYYSDLQRRKINTTNYRVTTTYSRELTKEEYDAFFANLADWKEKKDEGKTSTSAGVADGAQVEPSTSTMKGEEQEMKEDPSGSLPESSGMNDEAGYSGGVQ